MVLISCQCRLPDRRDTMAFYSLGLIADDCCLFLWNWVCFYRMGLGRQNIKINMVWQLRINLKVFIIVVGTVS